MWLSQGRYHRRGHGPRCGRPLRSSQIHRLGGRPLRSSQIHSSLCYLCTSMSADRVVGPWVSSNPQFAFVSVYEGVPVRLGGRPLGSPQIHTLPWYLWIYTSPSCKSTLRLCICVRGFPGLAAWVVGPWGHLKSTLCCGICRSTLRLCICVRGRSCPAGPVSEIRYTLRPYLWTGPRAESDHVGGREVAC